MASYFYTNFVLTLLCVVFVNQTLEFSHSNALTNVSCIGIEREALQRFKQDLIDPSRCLSSWTNESCCEWKGVECNKRTGHVSRLDLYNCSLGGEIHPALSELKHLKYIHLRRNNFFGHIPSQFWNVKYLKSLDLSYNSISGPIPATVGQLSSLTYLRLSHNNLSGNIPESIGQLSNLQYVDLSYNRLDGVVSELHLANLTNLTSLVIGSNGLVINVSASWVPPFQIDIIDMSSCKVGPDFPNWLRTQMNIWILVMSNASISGEVPHWLLDILSNNIVLNLSGNMLRGNISGIIGEKTPQLEIVSLSRNNFSGDISNLLCKLQSLLYVDLSKNQLFGKLPPCWGKSQLDLEWISLGDNKLNGQIPSTLCSLKRLEVLSLHNNGLNGVLPKCFLEVNLVILDLSGNLFTGRIPSFGNQAMVIDLERNYFTGDIPLQLCQLPCLQYLSLAQNNLSGGIPPCFDNFLQMFDNFSQMSDNFWQMSDNFLQMWDDSNVILLVENTPMSIMVNIKGRSLEFTKTLRYLFSIDLSRNSLEGHISEGLTKLARLQNLNLSQNKLIGKIPSDIGNLRYLESLDLSNNKLSGEIPPSISNLDFLSCLDLSFNNLSGHIPSGNHLSTLDEQSIYRGNDGLCGAPRLKVCPEDEHSDRDKQYGHDLSKDESNEGDSVVNWFYSGLGLGFAVAFMGFCGILHVNQSWRISHFQTIDRIIEKLSIGRITMIWLKIALQFQLHNEELI